jgi:hypothetical protein
MRLNRRQMMAMMASVTAAEALPFRKAVAAEVQGATVAATAQRSDPRNITNGTEIPRENYSDQPYVVITKDGNWLCVLTTGPGTEGVPGQHIIATISSDKGKTWSKPVDIEPSKGPEASWVMPLAVPSGRVYAFYTYNYDNLRLDTKAVNSETFAHRVDTIGKYAFKYSDDYGKTWSNERYYIPMRKMRIDRENPYHGERMYFWGVGKPIITRHGAMFGFAKVGKWGNPGGMMTSQGCVMQSPNILSERDPNKIQWNLLPDGDEGLRAPYGPVSDETNLVELNDGSLYATYRTIDGHNCQAYSRDAGHTWTPPAYATYGPNGRELKHPRAANFVKKFSNGKYLLWYHNHGGESVLAGPWNYYDNRNPAWVTGGIEKGGYIYWSEPEILVYDMDPKTKISYPDFVEDSGEFYVTETMKTHARVHHIDRSMLEGLWNQAEARSSATRGVAYKADATKLTANSTIPMPALPSLIEGGFTIEFWIRLRELIAGQTVLDARDAQGKGISIVSSNRCTLKITLNDGTHEGSWDNDPGTHPGALRVGVWQHVAFVVDGGPKIISAIVDGIFNDGGAIRDYGWGRFDQSLDDVNGAQSAKVAVNLFGELKQMRIYDRYLRTSEVIGNWRGDKA